MKILKIGSFELPGMAALDIDQRYAPLKRSSIFRTLSQRGIKQSSPAKKLQITTSGAGWIPAGLEEIDTDQQHLLACIVPRIVSANFATRQVTLPTARRADAGHLPYGLAIAANHQAFEVPVTMIGDVATVTAFTGAVAYKVGYYPLLLCWILEPTTGGPNNTWEFEAEEV